MDVAYADSTLEKRCTVEKEMARSYDKAIAKSLRMRIAELRSAETIADLLSGPGRWHWLSADMAGHVAGRLSGNWRIVVEPDEQSDDAGAVTVARIEDYHKK